MTKKQQMRKIVRTFRKRNGAAARVVKRALGSDSVDWPKWLDDLWTELVVADMCMGQPWKYGRDAMLLLIDLLCSELRECP
jgi:hypothetical protein